MVTAYFDTGVLVKLYVDELDSDHAIALVEQAPLPLPFTHIHRIELLTAIRLKTFRGELTAAEQRKIFRLVAADSAAGRLRLPDYDLIQVFGRAEELSLSHATAIGTRSLDILHVAAALECRCTEFCSFDRRQRALAAKTNLEVTPKRWPPSRSGDL